MPTNIEGFLRRFGGNSNSFLSLYPGFKYFYPDDPSLGCVPYLRTRSAWVGVAEPLAAPENQMQVLKAFSDAAAVDKRAAVLLPIENQFKERAEAAGFKFFQIGSEPYFDLKSYPPPGRDWLDFSHSAKSLKNSKGFTVTEFQIDETSRATRLELAQILQDWFDSRKMGELGFVNRVEPYTLPQYKKYFMVEGQDRIWAFLSCIPIWATNGWYFIDVFRRKGAPTGCVELLFSETMRLLRAEGAERVSLGVAPLAHLEGPKPGDRSLLSRITPVLFRHFQWFYNFESLYRFKNKFQPTEWRRSFVIHNMERTDLRLISVLSDVFVPQGALSAVGQMLRRKLDIYRHLREMHRWISESFIPRRGIMHPTELPGRAPLSLLLSFSWLATGAHFGPAKSEMGFSINAMAAIRTPQQFWNVIILPGFLHWNFAHLTINLITFAVVGITLEVFWGSSIVFLAYFTGLLFANGLTGAIIATLRQAEPFGILASTLAMRDVGASLGIFSCVGVWGYLLKNRLMAWTVFPAGILLVAILKQDYLQLNHIVAGGLGFGIAWTKFGRIREIKL